MEDAAIVKGLRLGDKTAFDELYEKYHLQLYRNAFLITGDHMDPAERFSDRDRIITALHMLDIKHREVYIR